LPSRPRGREHHPPPKRRSCAHPQSWARVVYTARIPEVRPTTGPALRRRAPTSRGTATGSASCGPPFAPPVREDHGRVRACRREDLRRRQGPPAAPISPWPGRPGESPSGPASLTRECVQARPGLGQGRPVAALPESVGPARVAPTPDRLIVSRRQRAKRDQQPGRRDLAAEAQTWRMEDGQRQVTTTARLPRCRSSGFQVCPT